MRVVGITAAWLLLVAGCAGSDGANVASGSGPIPTTAPLAVPPTLAVPGDNPAIATTAPIEIADSVPATAVPAEATGVPATAVPEATAVPAEATAVPATAVPEATAVSATAVPEATAVSATAVPVEATAVPVVPAEATAVPAEATAVPATAVPAEATAVPATAVPAAPAPSGASIALGDFEVVNLVSGQTQNIAELSPSGTTMLWFWAPH